MEITADWLSEQLVAMEVRHAHQVADLNVTEGALQVLRQILARAMGEPEQVDAPTDGDARHARAVRAVVNGWAGTRTLAEVEELG